jgi:hypothetical protein
MNGLKFTANRVDAIYDKADKRSFLEVLQWAISKWLKIPKVRVLA